MNYFDSSAIVKLVREEPETHALQEWIAANPQQPVTSALARTEAARTLVRVQPTALPTLGMVLALFHQLPVTDDVLDASAGLPGVSLRSLDAIHLATAEEVSSDLTWFVAYDKRLAEAASARGLPVASPQ